MMDSFLMNIISFIFLAREAMGRLTHQGGCMVE